MATEPKADRAKLERALILARELARRNPWRPLPGPQTQARAIRADIIGFGGSAGGGKTDLACGLSILDHWRCLFLRREKAQTEGIVQRLSEILGSTDGYNSQKAAWRLPLHRGEVLCEFGGLDNPGDERRWQGRAHDLKVLDEATEMRENQARFVMGWNRSSKPGVHSRVLMTFNPPTTSEGRWVIDFFGPWLDKKHPLYPTAPGELRYATMLPGPDGETRDVWLDRPDEFVMVNGKPCYEFDPAKHKREEIIKPKSRTFIPSRVTDNPYYMTSGYMSTLQALPEPLRSQMLYGDFHAGISDDPWQVIPTAWVEAAQARWQPRSPRGEMMAMGVDVARGGQDNSVIASRHKTETTKHWYDKLKVHPGSETPNGPRVAGLVIAERADAAPIFVDVIGVGASPYDVLNSMDLQVHGVNVSEKSTATDKSGRLRFMNQRSELWWKFRELLDPANDTGAAIPPDPALTQELCAPKWELSGSVIKVESREDIVKRTGRSPDRATAVILAQIDVPKIGMLQAARGQAAVTEYDPFAMRR